MSDRAVSTVLDVSLSLLLVSAAVLTLLTAPTPEHDPAAGRAEEIATTLTGSTATVSYDTEEENRTVHGTRAGLLADAAVSNRTPSSDRRLRSAVANATEPVLSGPRWQGQIVAIWRPFEGANDVAAVRVGGVPPDRVDVHSATMTVPSGYDPIRTEAQVAAGRNGFDGVADVLADAITGSAESRQSKTDAETEFSAALVRSFDTPATAANAVSVGRVHLTVRTWSA